MPRKKRSTLNPEYVATVLEVPDELVETEGESGAGGKRRKRKKSLPEDYLASFSDKPRKRRRRKRKRRRSAEGDDYLSVITQPPEREREKPRRKKASTTTIPSDYLDRVMDPPPDDAEEESSPAVSFEESRGEDGPPPSNVASTEESEEALALSGSEERKGRAPLPRGPDGRFLPRSGSETRSGERKKRGKGRSAPSPKARRRDERDERDSGPDEPAVSAKDAGFGSGPEPSPKAPFDPSTITFIALQAFNLPGELYERAQNVVRQLQGKAHEVTFARLVENALRAEIQRLENGQDDGEPSPGSEEATHGRGKRSREGRASRRAPAAKKVRKKTGGGKG